MINFIIYEEKEEIKEKYLNAIYSFIGKRKEKFTINNYNDTDKNNQSRNIYILSDKNIDKVLKIASDIRNNNNWADPIIIVSAQNKITNKLLENDLLILRYIDINKSRKIKNSLKSALYTSYKIITSNMSLNFNTNGEIHKILYKDILYIEKDNNQNYCIIKTINDEFLIKDTINNLEKKLDSVWFFKTNRSCIVNINNIKNYKLSTNTITFINDKQIDLISRDKKKVLKDRLFDEKITN